MRPLPSFLLACFFAHGVTACGDMTCEDPVESTSAAGTLIGGGQTFDVTSLVYDQGKVTLYGGSASVTFFHENTGHYTLADRGAEICFPFAFDAEETCLPADGVLEIHGDNIDFHGTLTLDPGQPLGGTIYFGYEQHSVDVPCGGCMGGEQIGGLE